MNIRQLTLSLMVVSASVDTSAATNQFNVTASGSQDYTINGLPDPALMLVRGFSYDFNINVSISHPFYIKTAQVTGTGSQYADGVSAQGLSSGTMTFNVPLNAPDTLHYQCGNHFNMHGLLDIVDPPQVVITELTVGSDVEIKSTGYDSDVLNLIVRSSSSLTTNTAWTTASILSSVHANGTNTTTIALPAEDTAFFQIKQGFF